MDVFEREARGHGGEVGLANQKALVAQPLQDVGVDGQAVFVWGDGVLSDPVDRDVQAREQAGAARGAHWGR